MAKLKKKSKPLVSAVQVTSYRDSLLQQRESLEAELEDIGRSARQPLLIDTSKPGAKGSRGIGRYFSLLGSVKRRRQEAREIEIAEKLEYILLEMRREFVEKEKQLKQKLQAIEDSQQRKKRLLKWVTVPLASTALMLLGLLSFIALGIYTSVDQMSTNMSAMSNDTYQMSQNMAGMNQNMAYMSQDVSQMNRNTYNMSRSIEPVGQAAENANPMLGMMRKMFPF